MARVDNFILNRSQTFSLGTNVENRTDLALTQLVQQTGRVRGNITNSVTGSPLADVTVKLRTLSGDPVTHTASNAAGNYIFEQITPGTYNIDISLDGFRTPGGQSFTLQGGQTLIINLTMTPESRPLNVLYGVVTNQVTGAPIDGAFVGFVPEIGTIIDLTVVRTNSSGQYQICEIPDSTQTLIVVSNGYYGSSFIPITISGGAIVRTDVAMQPFSLPQSTVNGFITNQVTGLPIENACVGLYLLNGSGVEILQQVTYSDSRGFYIFGRATAGTYVVKAKLEQVV